MIVSALCGLLTWCRNRGAAKSNLSSRPYSLLQKANGPWAVACLLAGLKVVFLGLQEGAGNIPSDEEGVQ